MPPARKRPRSRSRPRPRSRLQPWTRLRRSGKILLIALVVILLILSVLPFVPLTRLTDYLSGFRFLYLTLATPLGFLCLGIWNTSRTRGHAALTIAAAAALLINWLEIRPYYHPRSTEPTDAELTWSLRLLSFNLLHRNRNIDEVLAFVHSEEPDVAIFLEAGGDWPARLKPLARLMPHHFSFPELNLEIFSRIPVLDHELRRVGKIRGDCRLTLTGGLDLYASHAYPWMAYGKEGYAWRNEQLLERIGHDLANHPRPVVVMGDLNASLWSPVYKQMLRRSGLTDARLGFGPLPTQSGLGFHDLLGIPIDHCLVSDTVYVYRFRTGPALGSDHLPLIVDIAF